MRVEDIQTEGNGEAFTIKHKPTKLEATGIGYIDTLRKLAKLYEKYLDEKNGIKRDEERLYLFKGQEGG